MARQRKSVPDGRNSSSSNGSSDSKVMAPPRKPLWAYYKELLIGPAVVIIVVCTVMGYQQTRVNTPFDAKRVVTRTGLEVPEQFWGSYRPGVYFGLKTRDPHSLVMGLMWYFPYRLGPGIEGIRHWCDQGDNLESYGWIQHDGANFGVQVIRDGPFKLTTSFVKRAGGENGGDWTARVAVEVLPEFQDRVLTSEQISLIWYTALDEGEGSIALTNSNTEMTGIKGSTPTLGDFKLTLVPQQGKVDHESFVSTTASGLHLLKETVLSSLRLAADKTKQAKKIVLGGEIRAAGDEKKPPNFIAIQSTAKLPFSIDVVFESATVVNRKEQLVGTTFTKALQWQTTRFNQRFEATFHLKDKGFSQKQIQFAQATLSNMLGGIGYFYGSSSVQSIYTDLPVDYWKAPLFTAVPSRSFFPRGFLWDEGFHGLLIAQWDVDLELDIIAHWFDLMNAEGWIPREQILGVEALAKVPKEFVVQRNTNANPPTFFLTLQYILEKYAADFTNERLMVLERLYPRLQAWYQWFNSTQKGPLPGSFRWRGRDSLTDRELNPKTLTSGMDDYPRASHPTDLERHVDLYSWMAVASETMAKLAYILGRDTYRKYRETANYLMDNQLLVQLHWSNFSRRFADYGLHTDGVKLVRPTPLPRQPNQNMEMIRQVLKQPEYRLVDSVFGYGSLFPFLLQILRPTAPQLGQIIADIRDPNLVWTEYGLRSVAKTAPLYMAHNTEHDPPYWRGQIWININFLAVKALHHYAHIEGPHQSKAREVYGELRSNIINNVIGQYHKSGYCWEQYSDKNGQGSGCRPFTGWTALTVILMSETFD